MKSEDIIVNKIAQSGLITFDLETLAPKNPITVWDIKDQMFQGLILREKDFRTFVKDHDWTQYADHNVAITCSSDAIVPTWAYMLLANRLEPYAAEVMFGDVNALKSMLFRKAIDKLDETKFEDAKILVKGCSDEKMPEDAYVYFTTKLSKLAKSIMYGEACSSVPVFKRKNK